MDEFEISSEKKVSLKFHSRRFRPDGWLESYSVAAADRNSYANIHAENPPYGQSPVNFFQELADNWSGWNGEKKWGALEGEYYLRARTDLLGQITLIAELNPVRIPPCFSSILSLVVEAGQLEQLARRARLFFNDKG